MKKNPRVDHPKHYNMLDARCLDCGRMIECIDVVERMSFNLGNAVKYLWRAGLKGDAIEDIEKAIWYMQREIYKRKKEARDGRRVRSR